MDGAVQGRLGPIGWLISRPRALRIAFAFIVTLAAYPLSFGPACWVVSRVPRLEPAANHTYRPLLRVCCKIPGEVPLADLPINAFWVYGQLYGADAGVVALSLVMSAAHPLPEGVPRF
jgi:hypothetical protein